MSASTGPENLRVYGVLVRDGRALMSAENVAGRDVLKFPGGAVEPGEAPEAALKREFVEECGLAIDAVALLHVPGTLFSPWTHMPYTPLFYAVSGDGEPIAPDHEPLEVEFITPEDAVASGKMAEPDKIALRRAIALAEQT
jgi:8-oxo-dGTP pyrophosphatase MutT (NUDIX family)